MWPRLSYHDTIKLTKRSSPLSRKKWPKRGSSLCQNNLAGRRVDGNLIEQNDIFVQLREGRAREGGLFWRLFWQSERLPRLGALPSFYACHTRTVSISWENSPFLIARDIGRFPLRYMIPIYKTVENHAILQCIIYLILLQAKTIAKTRQIHHSLHRHIL